MSNESTHSCNNNNSCPFVNDFFSNLYNNSCISKNDFFLSFLSSKKKEETKTMTGKPMTKVAVDPDMKEVKLGKKNVK